MMLHKSIKGGLFFQIFFFQFQWCVWVLSMCESRTCFVFQRRVSGSREMRRWQKVWMFNTEISLKNKKCEPAADVHFRMKTRLGPVCCGVEGVLRCVTLPPSPGPRRGLTHLPPTPAGTGWVRPRLPPLWPCRCRTDPRKVRDQLGQTRMSQTVLLILTRGSTAWARFAKR